MLLQQQWPHPRGLQPWLAVAFQLPLWAQGTLLRHPQGCSGALLYHPSGSTEPRGLSRTGDVMSREVQFLINGSSKHKQYNLKALGLPFPASVDIPHLLTLLIGLQPRSQPVTRVPLYRTPSPRLAEPSSPQVPEWWVHSSIRVTASKHEKFSPFYPLFVPDPLPVLHLCGSTNTRYFGKTRLDTGLQTSLNKINSSTLQMSLYLNVLWTRTGNPRVFCL